MSLKRFFAGARIVLLFAVLYVFGVFSFLNAPVNSILYGPVDESCRRDSDCALKQTSCSVSCACPQPVNKNWNHKCFFGYGSIFSFCGPCISRNTQLQCVNDKCAIKQGESTNQLTTTEPKIKQFNERIACQVDSDCIVRSNSLGAVAFHKDDPVGLDWSEENWEKLGPPSHRENPRVDDVISYCNTGICKLKYDCSRCSLLRERYSSKCTSQYGPGTFGFICDLYDECGC